MKNSDQSGRSNGSEWHGSRQELQAYIKKVGNSRQREKQKATPSLRLNPGQDRRIKSILLVKSPTTIWESAQHAISSGISEEVPEPLGLVYLAAVLRENGYEVEIYDPHMEVYEEYVTNHDPEVIKSEIRRKFAKLNYDLIGVSSMFIYAYKWAHFTCDAAKTANHNIPVVIGGGHPSVVLDEVMKDSNIDYLIEGEGEAAFLELLYALNIGTAEALERVPALFYRKDGQVIHNSRKEYIWNLDEIPFPAWDLVDVDRYMSTYSDTGSVRKKTLMMITQRGCPFLCTFCNVFESWGYKFRTRSPENILAEVDYLIENSAVEEIMFVDDNMTIDKKRMMKICDGLKSRPITWRVVNIASFVTNEEMLRAMKESGCTKVSISVESGSEKVLKAMKKPVDLEWSENVIKICHEINLPVTVNFVSGMPYETKEDMTKTFLWAEKARADWSTFSILVPYPGTEIYEYSKRHNYLDEDSLDLEGLTQRNPTIQTENWTREWVSQQTYYYNIMVNFLRNYNLTEESGNLSFVTGFLENIVAHHPRHIIALICLAYAYHRSGKTQAADTQLARANSLLSDSEVIETYGQYLTMNEKVINFFRAWRSNHPNDLADKTGIPTSEHTNQHSASLGSLDFYGETVASEAN